MEKNLMDLYPQHKYIAISHWSKSRVTLHKNLVDRTNYKSETILKIKELYILDSVLYIVGSLIKYSDFNAEELENKSIRDSIHPDAEIRKETLSGRLFSLNSIFGDKFSIERYIGGKYYLDHIYEEVTKVIKDFNLEAR